MSQIYKDRATGPVPPAVPTSFITDVRNNTTSSPGTAVPAANVLQVLGRDTIQSNDNGIRTDADPNNGNILYVELTNRLAATTTTSDGAGQTQTIPLLTTTNGTAQTFRALISGIDVSNNVSTGAETLGSSRSSGGVTTVIGTNDVFLEEDAALAATDYVIQSTGGLGLEIEFTGIAGRTINWKIVFEYIQTP